MDPFILLIDHIGHPGDWYNNVDCYSFRVSHPRRVDSGYYVELGPVPAGWPSFLGPVTAEAHLENLKDEYIEVSDRFDLDLSNMILKSAMCLARERRDEKRFIQRTLKLMERSRPLLVRRE